LVLVGTRILTVEDDERIRTAVKMALEDEGWTVEETASGEEAIDAFGRVSETATMRTMAMFVSWLEF